MFERFTESARQVVVKADEEARAMRHQNVGGEHILLALVQSDSLAGLVLRSGLDINPDRLRTKIVMVCGQGDEDVVGQIPLQPQVKRILDGALRESLTLGHTYVGTEHLLLGLVREQDGVAFDLLELDGIEPTQVRELVIDHLMSPGYAKVHDLMVSDEDVRAGDLNAALDRVRAGILAAESEVARLTGVTGPRCKQALSLYGAHYVCQHEGDVPHDEHVEHGSGWTMRWTL